MFKWYLSVSDLFIEGLGLSFYGSYSDVDNNSTDTVPRRYNWQGEWVPNASTSSGERSRPQLHINNKEWRTNTSLNYTFNQYHTLSLNHVYPGLTRKVSDVEDPANEYNKVPQSIDKQYLAGMDGQIYTMECYLVRKVTKPVNELSTSDWPRLTGMTVSDNKIYITYYLTDETKKPSVTRYINKAYVAVYSYPELEYMTTMEDERAAIAGSWNAYNGIFQTESGDMYTFSNTSIDNGFTENSTKKAAFLHIPKGTTQFDDYYFDVEIAARGLKPVHLQYLGNGKFFAQVSTLQSEEMTRWADKELKACIIDVKEKTVKDIPQIPVHDGDGSQRMSGVIENGCFYIPLATDGALYFYKVDINNATAERGAKVASNFVSATFKMN